MNQLRGTPFKNMSVRDLRATVMAINNSCKVSKWSRQKCMEWLAENEIKEVNVGSLCRILLRVIIRINDDKYTVGLSYAKMVDIVKRHFPNSAVNERHFSWYATSMRAAGETIPVYRE